MLIKFMISGILGEAVGYATYFGLINVRDQALFETSRSMSARLPFFILFLPLMFPRAMYPVSILNRRSIVFLFFSCSRYVVV